MSTSRSQSGDGLTQNPSASSTSTIRADIGLHGGTATAIEPYEEAAEAILIDRGQLAATYHDPNYSPGTRADAAPPPFSACAPFSTRQMQTPPGSGSLTPCEPSSSAGHRSGSEATGRNVPRPSGPPILRLADDYASYDQLEPRANRHPVTSVGLAPPSDSIPMGWLGSRSSTAASSDADSSVPTTSGGQLMLGNPPQFDMRLQPPPPGYHTHDFPATPPALDFGGQSLPFHEAFDRRLRKQEGSPSAPPPDHPPSPIDPGPGGQGGGGGGGRFPRWRGWLEKRALERHYARMDAAAGVPPMDSNGNLMVQPPVRKKSWGTGVHDADAVEDDCDATDTSSSSDDGGDGAGSTNPISLPPLHVHHYGSRFIPHLHSQPLCSVLLELPPAPRRPGPRRSRARPRQVVLIGTADGLFLFQKPARAQRQKDGSAASDMRSQAEMTSHEAMQERSEGAKCIHVWSGLGIYQMCVLSSNDSVSSLSPFTSSASKAERGASGILLALTAPTAAVTSSYLPKPLVQLSAHAGTVFESVTSPSSGNGPGGASGSSHGHGSSFAEGTEGLAAANFGCAAGGGPGRAVPPGGSGAVRMWNLEALKKVVLYALDHESPQLPMDLVSERTASKEKKSSLASMLKKAFAKEKTTRADKQAKNSIHSRRTTSDGLGVVDPLPSGSISGSRRSSPRMAARNLDESSERGPQPSLDLVRETSRPSFQSDNRSVESFAASARSNKDDRDGGAGLIAKDPDLATALALALSSVPISAPTAGAPAPAPGHAAQGSYSSLFGADAYGPASGKHAHGKGKERELSTSTTGRGVLFFTVHEARPDTKGSGTWYLALATSKSVMVYEAVPAKRGSGRSWAWMKELYAPFAIKAIAFAPALVADTSLAANSTAMTITSATNTSMKLKVSSADAPLSASPKGAGQGSHNGKRPPGSYSSVLKPYHSLAGAAPTSWHRADLCVMVSFGRRSVMIRLSDSNVREFELMPLSEVIAATPGGTQHGQPHLALLPSAAGADLLTSKEQRAPRPHSIISLGLSPSISNPTSGVPRSAANDRQRDAAAAAGSPHEQRSNKHNWVGFTTLQAQIRVRQHLIEAESGHSRSRSSIPAGAHTSLRGAVPARPASYAQPHERPLPQVPSRNATAMQRNKALPQPPAPQSLSFDRRSSRQYLDTASRMAYETVQAESSSGSDDDWEDGPSQSYPSRGYSLHDTAPGRSNAGGSGGRGGRQRPRRGDMPHPSAGTDLVSVRMALVSRGSVTQVLPLPLPVDLARPLPLAVLQWSDTPNSVSGWARVLGVERARSSGSVSVERMRQNTRPVGTGGRPSPSRPPLISRNSSSSLNKGNVIGIHVGITVVAFLPSRVELKRVSFRTEAVVNFDLHRNAELELVPLIPPSAFEKPAKPVAGISSGPPSQDSGLRQVGSASSQSRSRNSIFGFSSDVNNGCWPASLSWHAAVSARLRSNLSTYTLQTTVSDATTADSEAASTRPDGYAWADLELEYLCGNLLTVNPIDLDVGAAGSEAAVSRLLGHGGEAEGSGESRSQVLKELAGDGGIVAYDWRGAEDYRIFCVGAEG